MTVADGGMLFASGARKDGKPIALLRGVPDGDAVAVEVDVYPSSQLVVEPLRRGPYRFETREAALRFVNEALLALEYLGCTIF